MSEIKNNDLYVRIRELLQQACSEETFQQLQCPVCGGPLSLNVQVGGSGAFAVRCSENPVHILMHDRCPVPPAWWAKRETSLGWY